LSLAAAPIGADDLSRAYGIARRIVDGARGIGASPRRTPDATPSATVHTLNVAEGQALEAQRKLVELNAALAALNADGKALFASLSTADKQSVAAALDALAAEYRNAVVRLENARGRLALSRRRLAAARGELNRLRIEETPRRQNLDDSQTRITYLRQRIGGLQRAIDEIEANRKWAKAEYARLLGRARAARSHYWKACREIFAGHGLGTPRDYTPVVEPLAAKTMRRPYSPPRPIAPAEVLRPFVVEPAKGLILVDVRPAIARPHEEPPPPLVTEEARRQRFLDDMDRVGRALREEAAAAADAEELTNVADVLRGQVETKAKDVAVIAERERQISSEERLLTATATQLATSLQSAAQEARRDLDDYWRAAKDSVFWQSADEALRRIVASANVEATFSRLMLDVVRLWRTFLFEDFPSAIRFGARSSSQPPVQDDDGDLDNFARPYITAVASHLALLRGEDPDAEKLTFRKWWREVEPRNEEERQILWNVLVRGERGTQILKGQIKDPLFPEVEGWSKRVLTVPKKSERNYRQLHFFRNERTGALGDVKWAP
jgi:hypothetical protein